MRLTTHKPVACHTHQRPSTTRYTLIGYPLQVQQEIDRIERQYPKWGYGTRATMPSVLQDGRVVVKITRSNSCD